jgi:hypothetical protein
VSVGRKRKPLVLAALNYMCVREASKQPSPLSLTSRGGSTSSHRYHVFDAVVAKLAIAESFILDGEMLLYNTIDNTFEEFGTLLSGFKAAASDKLTRHTVAGAGEVGDTRATVDKDGRMMLDEGTKWANLQIW